MWQCWGKKKDQGHVHVSYDMSIYRHDDDDNYVIIVTDLIITQYNKFVLDGKSH